MITLFVLALATILIVAFLSNMRLEQRSAHAFEHAQRSKLVRRVLPTMLSSAMDRIAKG